MLNAFFCDAAQADAGKLHIHGIFNELSAQGFPARHDRLLLCGIIEWRATDIGRKPFTVDLLDPRGQTVFTVEGHTDVSATAAGRAPARTNLMLPLEKVVFPLAGCYRTRFRIAGQESFGPDLYVYDGRKMT